MQRKERQLRAVRKEKEEERELSGGKRTFKCMNIDLAINARKKSKSINHDIYDMLKKIYSKTRV